MRPVESTIKETNTIEGETFAFGIGKGQEAWVMRSMADLYSNRELACIREYSTNAYDSNKEKALRDGHDIQPIEVTLPSVINPYFKVRDRGVGMDRQELSKVYTQFGDSTKRGSDDFNGMLGFGSKSAIAYTNTFTVTSVKNGYKNVGVITRSEDAMGGYIVNLRLVIDNMPTNEPSGVEIQIPVHNWREFEQKANDFYRYWMPGSVLVNGRKPDWAVGEKIADNFYYTLNSNTSYVVMGNVPYRVINSDALFPSGMNKIAFVAYVPMGFVEFTPSREDLKYSEHTKKNLHSIIEDFVKNSIDNAKSEIDNAKNHYEAYIAWKKWRGILGRNQVADLTYKGDKLVDEINLVGYRYSIHAYRYSTNFVKNWNVDSMHQTLIVSEFDIELKPAHRKKAKEWLAHVAPGLKCDYIVFANSQSQLDNPWIPSERVVTWSKMKEQAPKPARKPRVASVAWGRKAGSFDLISATGTKTEQDVPDTKNLYYIMVQELNNAGRVSIKEAMAGLGITESAVIVPANRLDKFLRHYPKAQKIVPFMTNKINFDGPSMLSADAVEFLSTKERERAVIGSLVKNYNILDPEIIRRGKIYNMNSDALLKEYNTNKTLATIIGKAREFKEHKWRHDWDKKDTRFFKDYPLAERYNGYGNASANSHIALYINAVYTARKNGENV